jgi:adenosine deaminase
LKNLGNGCEEYLNAVLRGIRQGEAKSPIKIGLVLSLRRDTSAAVAEQTIDLALQYRSQGVVGLDVSGDSVQGDGSAIFAAILRGKAQGLPLTLHIGESPKETPEQQMLELSMLQPERVGHCVHLCPEAQAWIREKNLLVELCLTSAVKASMITEPQDHPALSLLLQGHPVAICTDDPLIFNTTLIHEHRYVSQVTRLSLSEVQATQQKIGGYAF